MYRKFFRLLLLLVAVTLCGSWASSAEASGVAIQPSTSTISTGGSNITVDPYQSFNCTISLKAPGGGLPAGTPPGKIYIWATDTNKQIRSDLDVVALSIPKNVYVHQTERPGVLIMDTAALTQPRSFNLFLTATGQYTLHALYMPTGKIDPNHVSNYWPYELTGNAIAARTVNVRPTPAADVKMMVVSSKIRGIGIDSFAINNPRNQTIQSPLSVDSNTTTTTEVQLTLLRSNGQSVGKNVPVYIGTDSSALTISNVLVHTDANGVARFSINGAVSKHASLQIRCSLQDTPVTIPLQAYEYRPQQIRFFIGSNKVDIDGRTLVMDTVPLIKNNRTYVPFRFIGELLGAKIDYNHDIRTITASLGNTVLTMTIGYNHYAVNGQVHTMDVAPYVNNDGRTMVPIRFIANVFGYEASYRSDAKGRTTDVIFTRK